MCCFKRLAEKTRRKAGWERRKKAPKVTRPSEAEIKRKKRARMKPWERKAIEKKEFQQREIARKNKYLQERGLATILEES